VPRPSQVAAITCIALLSLALPPEAAAHPYDEIVAVQPVVLTGADLPDLLGAPIGEIWAYRYDAAAGSFGQVPVQVDERIVYDLTQGQYPIPVYELTYDWFGGDDGLLDGDDEVAFMARDAGDRAPDTEVWVPGADDLRVEVRLRDPLSGNVGWVYLFTSPGLADEDPTFSYVSYMAPDPETGIADLETPTYRIGFEGRWLLTRLEVGAGPDLLDRLKVRGYGLVGEQTEQGYEETSHMLGAYAGKVRAVREIQGAASGPLTTVEDIFYRDSWLRNNHLRVHLMPDVWVFLDYLPPPAPGRYYSETVPAGAPIDGVPDPPPSESLPSWEQVSLPGGTMVLHQWELTPFPYPSPIWPCAPDAGITFYGRDEAAFDDESGEDNAAYGNHGIHLFCTRDTNLSPYSIAQSHILLPPQDPYSPVGAEYAAHEETPLSATADSQLRAALTDARLEEVGRAGAGKLALAWEDALGEDSYEIYRGDLTAPFAFGHDAALACGLAPQATGWTTADDQETDQPSYYYLVVARRAGDRSYGVDGDGSPRPPSASPCP